MGIKKTFKVLLITVSLSFSIYMPVLLFDLLNKIAR